VAVRDTSNDMRRYVSGWNLLTGEEPPPCQHSKITEWLLALDALDQALTEGEAK